MAKRFSGSLPVRRRRANADPPGLHPGWFRIFAVPQNRFNNPAQAPYRAAANGARRRQVGVIERHHPSPVETALAGEVCQDCRQKCVAVAR
ncbi:hypothetical protein [Bradyrhizobium sp.]|uniref:hypothetical protein n=1 Tax=Bradyrhizobium sp. TaxID=376 RepID=UPI00260CB712|nr:hypothetical protein [Bradyrhizobium sp.]